jgi:hypothetical protein
MRLSLKFRVSELYWIHPGGGGAENKMCMHHRIVRIVITCAAGPQSFRKSLSSY